MTVVDERFLNTPSKVGKCFCHLLMENITLFAGGSIHQGNEPFGGESRGKQCAFMSLSALLCEQLQLVPHVE